MEFLHNSEIKKNASKIFELNAFDKPIDKVMPFVQPIVEVDNDVIIRTCRSTGAAVIYTTPANRDFYLTNIHINVWSGTGGEGSIAFTSGDGASISFSVNGGAGLDGTAQDITFPKRGVLLPRSHNIIVNGTADIIANCLIAGYLGSDRS